MVGAIPIILKHGFTIYKCYTDKEEKSFYDKQNTFAFVHWHESFDFIQNTKEVFSPFKD